MKRLNAAAIWKLKPPIQPNGHRWLTVDDFVDDCQKYFDWAAKSPWEITELVKYQGSWDEAEIPLHRPISMDGLCTYLGVSDSYFRTTKTKLREKIAGGLGSAFDAEFVEAIEFIETFTRTHQLEGAAVGVYKESLIAKWAGLAENINNTISAEAGLRITVRDNKTANDLEDLENLL